MSSKVSKKDMEYFATQCASFNFRKAARVITQLFDNELQPVGLRSTQLVVLLAAGIYENATMSKLADVIVADRTTLTRALKPLFVKGYLKSVTGKDKRKTSIVLTDKGHQIVLKSVPYWTKAQSHVIKTLGPKNWENLRVALDKVSGTVKKTRAL
jgi:DNA-binding MarR family transcriptional regulator